MKKSPATRLSPPFQLSPKTLRILELLCWVTLAVLLIQAFHKAYRVDGYDFTPRLEAAKALVAGTNPYSLSTPFPLTYPMFICVLLIPLAWLPYWLSNFIWFALSAALFWFSMRALMGFYDSRQTPVRFKALLILCFFLSLNLVQNNFVNGQVNIFVLSLCLFSLKYLLEKKPALAGWLLAAAISFKLTPQIGRAHV